MLQIPVASWWLQALGPETVWSCVTVEGNSVGLQGGVQGTERDGAMCEQRTITVIVKVDSCTALTMSPSTLLSAVHILTQLILSTTVSGRCG